MHLAAVMLAIGYGAVIGTMWSIGDADAPLVSLQLYSFLTNTQESETHQKKLSSAYALHYAVETLRAKVGEDEFIRWVPFVHFGL